MRACRDLATGHRRSGRGLRSSGCRMAITTQAKLDETALLELESSLRGELLRPDHPSYDEGRRVWNGSISRRPALIARCTGVADVIASVQCASLPGMGFCALSRGHLRPA